MTSTLKVTLGAIAVTLASAGALMASPCRAETCYAQQIQEPGDCPEQEDVNSICANIAGCPAQFNRASCAETQTGRLITCCYNGNTVGACSTGN